MKCLAQQSACTLAESGKPVVCADAAGHAESQIALQQGPDKCCQALRQKAEDRQKKSAGRAACCRFPTHGQDSGIDWEEPQQKAAPLSHLCTELFRKCEELAPEENTAPTCRDQIKQFAVGGLTCQKRQKRSKEQK